MAEVGGEDVFNKGKQSFFSKFFDFFSRKQQKNDELSEFAASFSSAVDDFIKMKASDVMLDRSTIAFVGSDDLIFELYDLFLLGSFANDSRNPVDGSGAFANDRNIIVCEGGDLDKPLGFLSCADFRKELHDNLKNDDFVNENVTVIEKFSPLLKKIIFVAPSMSVSNLVKQFRSNDGAPFVIVVDEYRGTDGIITFDSLAKSIFEYVVEEPDISSADSLEVDGHLPLRALEKKLKIKIKENDPSIPSDIKTVGGLAAFFFGRIPCIDESIFNEKLGLRVEIKNADPKQIKKLLISKISSDQQE